MSIPSHTFPAADNVFVTLLESLPDGVCLLNPDGTIVHINSVLAARFGKHPQECIDADIHDLMPPGIQHMPDVANRRKEHCREVLGRGMQLTFEEVVDDQISKITINPVRSAEGEITRLLFMSQDITEIRRAENHLCLLSRYQLAISNCNQALLRANDEMELLKDICRIVVEIGGYRMAWVGYAQDDAEKSVVPVAQAGFEDGYLETLWISWDDVRRGQGPTGTAIRTGEINAAHNLLRAAEAIKRGYSSALSIPLKKADKVFGALTIYSSLPDAFDVEETKLLGLMADNLAYGIRKLRNRKAREVAEDSLRQSEARYRSLFQNNHTVMLIVDPEDGSIVDANPAAVNYYGWDYEKLCRLNISEINTLTDKEIQAEMQRAQRQKCNFFSFRHRLADGSVRDVEVYSGPIKLQGKSLLYSIVNDVTERKHSQELLIEGSNRMHYIMGATNAGLWEIDLTTNTTIWSEEVWELYGLEPDSCEPSFENWLKTIVPEDRANVEQAARDAVESALEFSTMWRVQQGDGTERWLMSKGIPYKDSDGKVQRFVGIVMDITDRKKEEEEKRQLENQLFKAKRLESIGAFAGTIAHDFKNILTPILGYSEIGLLSVPDENPAHDYFSQISQAADRAKNLISQILAFSRAEDIELSIVCMPSVITEALDLLRSTIPDTITIEQHIDSTCRKILADTTQLHRIIVNLCTNAIQALDKQQGFIRIELKEVNADSRLQKALPQLVRKSYLRLSISDSGPGIDEAVMEHIFEPFFTTKTGKKGTGLGLSTVYGIVNSFNGAITVDSHPGKGTAFHIYLPVIDEQSGVINRDRDLLRGRRRILFVDDEESNIRIMTTMLTKLGFTVQSSNSPTDAIALFRNNPGSFDLVITDLMMPEMRGTDLAASLQRIYSGTPRIPIILMTGYEKDLGDVTTLSKYGISGFLKKPVRMSQISTAINELISDETT